MPGSASSRRRNAGLEMTSALDGSVSVTAAVVGRSVTSEISPKKSPAPSVLTLRPFRRTSASPSSRTKNWRPGSPSRISSFPAGRSISSAIFAISFMPRFETPPKSGTRLSTSILLEAWWRRRIGAILRREQVSRLLRVPRQAHPLERCERLFDQRTVAAYLAQSPPCKRLDVGAPELEERFRLVLDALPVTERDERLEARDLRCEVEPKRVSATQSAGQRPDQPFDLVEIVLEQRQPHARRREHDVIALHPHRLRLDLEPLRLCDVSKDAVRCRTDEQAALVANTRRAQVFRDRPLDSRGQVVHGSPVSAQFLQLSPDGDAVQAMVRRQRLCGGHVELGHCTRRLEAT